MAGVNSPLKIGHWILAVQGVDQATIQSVEFGEISADKISHFDTDSREIKTAAPAKYGDITLKKITREEGGDSWVWDWMQSVIVGSPAQYKRNLLLIARTPGGVTVQTYDVIGAWPANLKPPTFERGKGDNAMEEVKLSIDNLILRN